MPRQRSVCIFEVSDYCTHDPLTNPLLFKDGQTALHTASLKGHAETASVLIAYGANIDVHDEVSHCYMYLYTSVTIVASVDC